MVGRSNAMQSVFDVLGKASYSDATILLEGETGTGKEVSAEAIHRGSRRRDKPFLVVDCGAMPPQLLESELFGHERGAFTGAVAARQGVFEAASGGTVVLDEIGELSVELQPKLRRVLGNCVERCVALRDFSPPQSFDTPSVAATSPEAAVNVGQPLREAREGWVSSFEKRYLEELLRVNENRVSAAARAAGVDRIYFYRLLWKHGLRTRESAVRDGDERPS